MSKNADEENQVWGDSNFKGNRKFLRKCLGFRANVELLLKGIQNNFIHSLSKMSELQKGTFWPSKYFDLIYYQKASGNREFGKRCSKTSEFTPLKRADESQVVQFFAEEDENHIFLKFYNVRRIFYYKVTPTELIEEGGISYPAGPVDMSSMGAPWGKKTIYAGGRKFLREVQFVTPNEKGFYTTKMAYQWEMQTITETMQITIIVFSGSGDLLGYGDTERTVKLIETKTRDEIKTFEMLHQSNRLSV